MKYLPSPADIVHGVIIIIIGFVVWGFVSAPIAKLTAKLTPSAP